MRVNDCEHVPHWKRLELVVMEPDGEIGDAILIRPLKAGE
jgi:hypothetical protein